MLHGHILESVDSAKYLGVSISEDLSPKTHVDNISSKTLGFLRRNLHNCTKEVRETTYNTLVRPTLEYASSAWDPHLTTDINRLEQVQRRAARFVTRNYWERTPGCVSSMITNLGWDSLAHRRRTQRLTMLYKIQGGLVDVDPGPILRRNDMRTRGGHRFYQRTASQRVYKYFFYPRTIQEWNRLPTAITDHSTIEGFNVALVAVPATFFVGP